MITPAATVSNHLVSKSLVAPDQAEALRRVGAWLNLERQRRKITAHAGNLEAIEEPGGGRCQYAYNHDGDLIRLIEANGRSTAFAYDGQRRLARVDHPDGTGTRYVYGGNDRLILIDDRGVLSHFAHDALGRVAKIQRGNAGATVFRYDESGRVIEARTPAVSTQQQFDAAGRVSAICQILDGVEIGLRLQYDAAGRLAQMFLPGSAAPICYQWDAKGRPQTVALDSQALARFEYCDEHKTSRLHFGNGIVETTEADSLDRRPLRRQVLQGERILFQRDNECNAAGQIIADGARRYEYDRLGRLASAEELAGGARWRFDYDALDNRIAMEDAGGMHRFQYDLDNRLVEIHESDGGKVQIDYDRFGRPLHRNDRNGQRTHRYDDAGRLLQVLDGGNSTAQFVYDHKGRLVLAKFSNRTERYLYGPADELLAATDETGNPLRLYIRTPLGLLAEIHGAGEIYFRHHDDRGTCYLVTDEKGEVAARFNYTPFGAPAGNYLTELRPVLQGRFWNPEIGLYNFGSRWYDPSLGRFLTPDSFTGRPDDERIVHPLGPGSKQVFARPPMLADWLRQPRVRHRYVFCGNDPVNRVDPNGHWSFGGVLLMLLGAIWTLPNTVFGLLVEITCLVGEVVRWLVWLVSAGNVTWATPWFDAAASGRLNAFAIVFTGGWLGSFSSLLGITFGNVFFVQKGWENHAGLYEHELRHTNQYGWLGPFFHLGLPLFGVYEWDLIFHGYENAWLERDARDHGGF